MRCKSLFGFEYLMAFFAVTSRWIQCHNVTFTSRVKDFVSKMLSESFRTCKVFGAIATTKFGNKCHNAGCCSIMTLNCHLTGKPLWTGVAMVYRTPLVNCSIDMGGKIGKTFAAEFAKSHRVGYIDRRIRWYWRYGSYVNQEV